MLARIYVDFEELIQNEIAIIDFLAKNSDTFSIVVILKKPYSQKPPLFNYAEQLRPYITDYLWERSDWLIDYLGRSKHQMMVVCRCCKESRKELSRMPNLFLSQEGEAPEDIAFYRNGKLWFSTITHEKTAFFANVSKEEVSLIKKQWCNCEYLPKDMP